MEKHNHFFIPNISPFKHAPLMLQGEATNMEEAVGVGSIYLHYWLSKRGIEA